MDITQPPAPEVPQTPKARKPAKYRRGDGSVFFDAGKKCWVARVPVGNGKRLAAYAHTKPEAVVELKRLRGEVEKLPVVGTAQSVGAYLDFWLSARMPDMRLATYANYARTVNRFLRPMLGTVLLAELNALDVLAMYEAMGKAGHSPAARRLTHSVLSTALSYAVKTLHLIPHNVCHSVPKPRATPAEQRHWNLEQLERFKKGSKDVWFHNYFLVAAHSGAREGEMLALHWDAVDFKAGTICIYHTLTEIAGVIRGRYEPKSKASKRTIHLDAEAMQALRAQRAQLFKAGFGASPIVFPNAQGEYAKKSRLRMCFIRACRAAGVPVIRIHDLRHTHATLLIAAGEGHKAVADRLGHSDVALTLRTYVHVDAEARRATADRFGALTSGNGKA